MRPTAPRYIRATAPGGGWAGPVPMSMTEYYQKNVPSWKNVDYYCDGFRQYESRSGTAEGIFKLLENTLGNDVLKWEETAYRYMNDETRILSTMSSHTTQIQQFRIETMCKETPPDRRRSLFLRMQSLNARRNRLQKNLNEIAEVLILICRHIRKIRNATAGVANLTE